LEIPRRHRGVGGGQPPFAHRLPGPSSAVARAPSIPPNHCRERDGFAVPFRALTALDQEQEPTATPNTANRARPPGVPFVYKEVGRRRRGRHLTLNRGLSVPVPARDSKSWKFFGIKIGFWDMLGAGRIAKFCA